MSPTSLAIFAYAMWGLVPVYWKQLPNFSAEELILFRILLSALFLLPIILYRGEGKRLFQIFRTPSKLLGSLAASLLIGFNWYLYIWAIGHNHVVESSLGYFLNPLVNMALGTLFLKERMNRAQSLACCFAAAGTLILTWQTGSLPWVSILLALSFGFYGFTRKILQFPTLAGTFLETVLLSLPATFGLLWLSNHHGLKGSAAPSSEITWLLLSGAVTTIPLLAFAEAAKSLPLTVMGFLQFLSPSLQFMLGVFLFKEQFSPARWVSFSVIWFGLLIFLWDIAERSRFACSYMPSRK